MDEHDPACPRRNIDPVSDILGMVREDELIGSEGSRCILVRLAERDGAFDQEGQFRELEMSGVGFNESGEVVHLKSLHLSM
jgi:hypothetical protein